MGEPLSLDETPDGEEPWPSDQPERGGRGAAHFAILVGLIIATLAIIASGLALEPDPRGYGTHEQLGLNPCRMFAKTAVPCPACGVTTAVTLSAQGNFLRGAITQPLGPILVILVPMLTVLALVRHRRGDDLYQLFQNRSFPWVWAAFLVGVLAWVYRIVLVSGW